MKRDTEGFGYWRKGAFHITGSPDLDRYTGILPPAVSAHAKLEMRNPDVYGVAPVYSVAEMNDTGNTFAEIADVIEAQL